MQQGILVRYSNLYFLASRTTIKNVIYFSSQLENQHNKIHFSFCFFFFYQHTHKKQNREHDNSVFIIKIKHVILTYFLFFSSSHMLKEQKKGKKKKHQTNAVKTLNFFVLYSSVC